jgi:ABC-2 type transport system ATP-binding protein
METAETSAAVVEVHDLWKSFGSREVCRGIDMQVGRGEVVALMGRNGAGKSTLLRILAGAVIPDSGTVTVAGCDVLAHRTDSAAVTGVAIGDEHSWYLRLSGRENLEFFGALRGLTARERRAAATRAIEEAGLEDASDLAVGKYSSGMRARLALARARLRRSLVLLLDEPSSALDQGWRHEFHESLADDPNRPAVILVTHDPREAAEVAARALILEQGKVTADVPATNEAAISAALEEA